METRSTIADCVYDLGNILMLAGGTDLSAAIRRDPFYQAVYRVHRRMLETMDQEKEEVTLQ